MTHLCGATAGTTAPPAHAAGIAYAVRVERGNAPSLADIPYADIVKGAREGNA